METGYRLTDDGKPIARNVIRLVTCRYNGAEVFRAEPSSGIAANPLFTFYVTARESGEVVFEWVDDAGARQSERAAINVAG
jgi:sulfur-oxidizing protein SoxZ